jgi:hypothetical protein
LLKSSPLQTIKSPQRLNCAIQFYGGIHILYCFNTQNSLIKLYRVKQYSAQMLYKLMPLFAISPRVHQLYLSSRGLRSIMFAHKHESCTNLSFTMSTERVLCAKQAANMPTSTLAQRIHKLRVHYASSTAVVHNNFVELKEKQPSRALHLISRNG